MSSVGRAVPVSEREARVRGRVPFAGSVAVPDMLHGRIVRSSIAHGIVRSVDTRRALAVPGVVAVLTGHDLLRGDIEPYYGPVLPDRPLVAIDRVRFVGEPIAAVIATDPDAAAEAAHAVEAEIEPLPAVFTADEAVLPGAPVLHDAIHARDFTTFPDLVLHTGEEPNICNRFSLRLGDVDAGFADADEVFEDVFRTPTQQHAALEPHVTVAAIDAGKVTIWSSSASPYTVRSQVAETLRVPEADVRVIVGYVGGAFGAKTYPRHEPLVAAMSWRVGGRPVRVALDHAEEFSTIVRHASTVTIRTGVSRDGRLLARQVRILWNAGAYADISPRLIKNGGYSSAGPYRIPNVAIDSFAVYTNTTPSGGFRGYGVPQVAWAYENQMDLIAERLGIDPVELRLRNVLADGDAFATGQAADDMHLADLVRSAAQRIGWSGRGRGRTPAIGSRTVRGTGISCIVKTTVTPSTSTAIVKLNPDGSANLLTSSVEIGQGSRTTLGQIVADAVGVDAERVAVSYPDTDATPWDQTTSSSRTTVMMGEAARRAGAEVRRQLLELAADRLEASVGDLVTGDGRIWSQDAPDRSISYADVVRGARVGNLMGSASYTSEGGLDPETGLGIATVRFYQAAAGAEVEVDLDTGRLRLLRLHADAYAGRVVHPTLAELQCEGSATFGIGQALFEDVIRDEGQVVNASLADYMIPSLVDLPDDFSVGLHEAPGGEGQIHGLGESTTPPVPAAIGNAVYDAIGVRIHDLPLTPEKILRALAERAAAQREA